MAPWYPLVFFIANQISYFAQALDVKFYRNTIVGADTGEWYSWKIANSQLFFLPEATRLLLVYFSDSIPSWVFNLNAYLWINTAFIFDLLLGPHVVFLIVAISLNYFGWL